MADFFLNTLLDENSNISSEDSVSSKNNNNKNNESNTVNIGATTSVNTIHNINNNNNNNSNSTDNNNNSSDGDSNEYSSTAAAAIKILSTDTLDEILLDTISPAARTMDYNTSPNSNNSNILPEQQQGEQQKRGREKGDDCIDGPVNNDNEQCDCLTDHGANVGDQPDATAATSAAGTSIYPSPASLRQNIYGPVGPPYEVNLASQSRSRRYSSRTHHPHHRLSAAFSPSARLYGLDSMMEADDRLRTFDTIRDKMWFYKHDILSLVKAGFFANNYEDSVRCFSCNLILFHWQLGEDPIAQHCLHARFCPYMRVLVGGTYIESIRRQFNQ
jgi:hypothetical protein